MSNEAVSGVVHWALSEAVRRAIYWDVDRAVALYQTVYWAVGAAMNGAVHLAMNGAVHWAMDETVAGAPHEAPPHPGLALYLGKVG